MDFFGGDSKKRRGVPFFVVAFFSNKILPDRKNLRGGISDSCAQIFLLKNKFADLSEKI